MLESYEIWLEKFEEAKERKKAKIATAGNAGDRSESHDTMERKGWLFGSVDSDRGPRKKV